MRTDLYIHPLSDVKTLSLGSRTRIWQFVVILAEAKIGENCNICSHCFIENRVFIGNNVTIKNGVYIYDGTIIEDDVFVGPGVKFTNDKYPRSKRMSFDYPTITIKKGASIGAGSILLPGITIGENAIVGAGTLVARDVQSNALVKNPRSQTTLSITR